MVDVALKRIKFSTSFRCCVIFDILDCRDVYGSLQLGASTGGVGVADRLTRCERAGCWFPLAVPEHELNRRDGRGRME
jgi:hypothetical protein